MVTLTVTGAENVQAQLADFTPKSARACVRAMNRAIASAGTVMVRAIASDTGLKSSDVRKALPVMQASLARPTAQLAASLKRIPLIDFRARGPEPSRGRGRGVTYGLPGSRGRIANAFIATMRSGHRGVFVRAGKARLPIKEAFGPSLGHVFAKYRAQGEAKLIEAFKTNYDHEMAFVGGADAGTD